MLNSRKVEGKSAEMQYEHSRRKVEQQLNSYKPNDCKLLESDINYLANWCTQIGIKLNDENTKIITYSHKTHNIKFQYSATNTFLQRPQCIMYLDIFIESELYFHHRTDNNTSSIANRTLRVSVKRFGRLLTSSRHDSHMRKSGESNPGVAAHFPALDGEVSVGDVLWRRWLVALHRLAPLLQLHVGEHGDEQDEDDEAHAAAHDEPQAACEHGAHAGPGAGRVARGHPWGVERPHLGAARRRRVCQLEGRLGGVASRRRRPPAAEAAHAHQVPRARQQTSYLRGPRTSLHHLAAHLHNDIHVMLTRHPLHNDIHVMHIRHNLHNDIHVMHIRHNLHNDIHVMHTRHHLHNDIHVMHTRHNLHNNIYVMHTRHNLHNDIHVMHIRHHLHCYTALRTQRHQVRFHNPLHIGAELTCQLSAATGRIHSPVVTPCRKEICYQAAGSLLLAVSSAGRVSKVLIVEDNEILQREKNNARLNESYLNSHNLPVLVDKETNHGLGRCAIDPKISRIHLSTSYDPITRIHSSVELQLVSHALEELDPIVYLRGNDDHIPCHLAWGKTGASINEQIAEARVHKVLWNIREGRGHGLRRGSNPALAWSRFGKTTENRNQDGRTGNRTRVLPQCRRGNGSTDRVAFLDGVVGDAVSVQAGVVSALPGHEYGEGLNVLYGDVEDDRRGAEGRRLQVEEEQTSQLRWLLAAQPAGRHAHQQLLVIVQPFP
ncbi:hypothetical protein PR048_010655 [Dryococelus australis]|uniref:Uncharacterized protein n=1 Tax=Dryococelus australis TaxID=614101 RepID=A0ABQ9I448_9NEOP|nr:hypothetical protein PR048_010655 [Dryococelus australis]